MLILCTDTTLSAQTIDSLVNYYDEKIKNNETVVIDGKIDSAFWIDGHDVMRLKN